MKINTTKDRSSETEFIFKPDRLWVRAVNAMKTAFFPTRCLTCGSFYRVDRPFRNSLKSIPGVLNRKDLNVFISDSFSTARNQDGDTYNYGSSSEARVFASLMSPFLCTRCCGNFLAIEPPICSACGVVFKTRIGEDHLCGKCLSSPKNYGMARSAGVYDKVLMAAIHCLKYRGKIQLARPLGVLLFFIFRRNWKNENHPDLIIPVPLHKKKIKDRGFNPSFFLVREWSAIARTLKNELAVAPVADDILLRTRWTKSQTGLGRKERLKNIKNAFSVNDGSRVSGEKILLIDDVYTTGATANECSKVLMSAGASNVDVLTLARAM